MFIVTFLLFLVIAGGTVSYASSGSTPIVSTGRYTALGPNPVLVDAVKSGDKWILSYSLNSGAIVVSTDGIYFNVTIPGGNFAEPTLVPYGGNMYLVVHGTNNAGGTSAYIIDLSSLSVHNYTLPFSSYRYPYLTILNGNLLELVYPGAALHIDLDTWSATLYNASVSFINNRYYVANKSVIQVYDSDWNYLTSYNLTYTGTGTVESGPTIYYAFSNGTAIYFGFTSTVNTGGFTFSKTYKHFDVYSNGQTYRIARGWDVPKVKYTGSLTVLLDPESDAKILYSPAFTSIPSSDQDVVTAVSSSLAFLSGNYYYTLLGNSMAIIPMPSTGDGAEIFNGYSINFAPGASYSETSESYFSLTEITSTTHNIPPSQTLSPTTSGPVIQSGNLNFAEDTVADVSQVIPYRIFASIDNGKFIMYPPTTGVVVAAYDFNSGSLSKTVSSPTDPYQVNLSDTIQVGNTYIVPELFSLFYHYGNSYYLLASGERAAVFNISNTLLISLNAQIMSATYNDTAITVTIDTPKTGYVTTANVIERNSMVSVKIPQGKKVAGVLVDGNPTDKYIVEGDYVTVDPDTTVVVLLSNAGSGGSLGGNATSMYSTSILSILALLVTVAATSIAINRYLSG